MDRLTTGRRHVRAGSVSVTELIIKLDVPPDSLPDQAATEPVSHRQPPSRGAQVVKVVSLGVATAALCGAVTVASMIADRRGEAGTPAGRPSVQITGEQALLPDQLNQKLTPAGCPACARPAAPPVGPPAPAPNTKAQHTDDQTATPEVGGTSPTSATNESVVAPPSDLDLVREFYTSLPTAPAHAFGLLSPELIGTSFGEFLSSWSTVSSIEMVDLTQRADGVLAVVRMHLNDGGQLRVQQLLTVAESPRRIVGVQLLSAQRN